MTARGAETAAGRAGTAAGRAGMTIITYIHDLPKA